MMQTDLSAHPPLVSTIDTPGLSVTEKRAGGVWNWFRLCTRRAALRRELLSLYDRMLRDIGIDRTRARREATRAPWQA
jgi:uncharacterized protein YjiS (DUF1127 family)